MKIKGKPDVTAFLDGAKAEQKSTPSPALAPVATEARTEKPAAAGGSPKRQKLVELPEPLFHALKDRAYEDYKRTGKRVTETEIIVAALSKYLGIQV